MTKAQIRFIHESLNRSQTEKYFESPHTIITTNHWFNKRWGVNQSIEKCKVEEAQKKCHNPNDDALLMGYIECFCSKCTALHYPKKSK